MSESLKDKKKLLVFHPALAPYRIDLFNSLHALYCTQFYFLNENVLSQRFSQPRLISSTQIHINYLNKGFSFLGRFIRFGLYGILKKEQPDIILSTEYSTITLSLYVLSRLINKKVKFYTLTEDNVSMMVNASFVQTAVRKFLLKRIDGVIVTHQEIQEHYSRKFKAKTKFIIFPTIRMESLYRNQIKEGVSASNTNIDKNNLEGKEVLLYVGRLVEVKNLERLIEAFRLVKKNRENAVLVFVGEGNKMEKLKQLVSNYDISNSVVFTGRLEGKALLSWYNTSNLFILPSTFEPFGAVINEALLAGCSALVSNRAGGACLVRERINGFTFDPFNVDEMANIINRGFEMENAVSKSGNIKDSKMLIDYSTTINSLFEIMQ